MAEPDVGMIKGREQEEGNEPNLWICEGQGKSEGWRIWHRRHLPLGQHNVIFSGAENQKEKNKKKRDLGIPGSNFRDNNKFPRALGGLERSTSSPEHLEHIYPSNSSWWLEVKIASLDELESEGGKSLNSSWNVYFWEEPEEEEERSGFNALFRACKEIITGAKMQEGEDGGRARNDNLKDFFFKRSLEQLGIILTKF